MEPLTVAAGTGISTYLATRALKNGESEALKTIDNLFFHVFGNFNLYSDKRRLAHENELEFFQKSLAKKVDEIPEDQLIDPPISIIGPVLEASKYYLGDETLRDLFANLIAASCNIEKSNYVHPSFVEIIKQMSPMDALTLQELSKNESNHICCVDIYEKNITFKPIKRQSIDKIAILHLERLVNPNTGLADLEQVQISYSSLERLGLIVFERAFVENENVLHKIYQNSEVVNYFKSNCLQDHEIALEPGSVKLTALGKKFSEICLSN